MKELIVTSVIKVYKFDELSETDRMLIRTAMDNASCAYAPYSRFFVGVAARLVNGMTVTGSNQENAAYPSGLCAERITLFYAGSQYPDQAVEVLAVAARTEKGFTDAPVTPCGGCRQVLLETEKRYNRPIRILLYGKEAVYEIKSARELLPLAFGLEV